MADTQKTDVLLDDPLKAITRKERMMLLSVSLLGIVLVKTGLIPTQISALGIQFTQTNQQALLLVVSLVDIYFLCAFIIYAFADYLTWRKALLSELIAVRKEYFDEEAKLIQEEEADMYGAEGGEDYFEQELNALYKRQEKEENRYKIKYINFKKVSWYVSIFRGFFEFGLPLIVGIYSILLLWHQI